MTDKRVELPPIEITREDVRRASDLVTMDGSGPYYPCYPEFQCRERQLLSALTKISQLEQQILEIQGNAAIRFAEAEARWHRAEEFLDAVDSTLCSCRFDDKPGCNCDIHHAHKLVAQYRQDSAAEGGLEK